MYDDDELTFQRPERRRSCVSKYAGFALVFLGLVLLYAYNPADGIAGLSTVKSWLSEQASSGSDAPESNDSANARGRVTAVVASIRSEDTSWLDLLPDWDIVKYVGDDLDAVPSVPINKGHEAMAYLTYIIDHYDALPDVMVFLHAQRYQWHNDDPLIDGLRMLSHLQIPYIRKAGYASLRCVWRWGCDEGLAPLVHGDEPFPDNMSLILNDAKPWLYKPTFQALFPGEEVPAIVGAACCGQFAVSADTVRRRELGEYQRVRRWLIETELPDNCSGRLMEYMWHILFKQPAFLCPSAEACYCNLYGKCHLSCPDEASCDGQWNDVDDMPSGWPELDADGNPQDLDGLRAEQEADYDQG